MDDLFSDDADVYFPAENKSHILTRDPFSANTSTNNNILDDLFANTKPQKQDISYPSFFKSKTTQDHNSTSDNKDSTNPITTDILFDFMEHPNSNSLDESKLFTNVAKPCSKSKSQARRSHHNGMLTKEIQQINKITPSAKHLIASFFKHACYAANDVIVPECVEILGLMYLGHPLFIHCYAGDKNAQPLQSSHKLFVLYGYHTLDILLDEYMKYEHAIRAITKESASATFNPMLHENNSVHILFGETFKEKEKRIWRRDIQMPIPPYNGSYREMFDHIDDLFFSENEPVQYKDWDAFLEIDKSVQKEKSFEDEWELVVDSIAVLFDCKHGLPELEILIEQKGVLSDWIRPYAPPTLPEPDLCDPFAALFDNFTLRKDIMHQAILNLVHYK
eukprot:197798_1